MWQSMMQINPRSELHRETNNSTDPNLAALHTDSYSCGHFQAAERMDRGRGVPACDGHLDRHGTVLYTSLKYTDMWPFETSRLSET